MTLIAELALSGATTMPRALRRTAAVLKPWAHHSSGASGLNQFCGLHNSKRSKQRRPMLSLEDRSSSDCTCSARENALQDI